MLIKLLENRFTGIGAIILSILVFYLGMAVPIYTLAMSKKAAEKQEKCIAIDFSDLETEAGDEIPIGDEDDQRPTQTAEEEDEKSKEMREYWLLADIHSNELELIDETHNISHRPYEVTTPPPEA